MLKPFGVNSIVTQGQKYPEGYIPFWINPYKPLREGGVRESNLREEGSQRFKNR